MSLYQRSLVAVFGGSATSELVITKKAWLKKKNSTCDQMDERTRFSGLFFIFCIFFFTLMLNVTKVSIEFFLYVDSFNSKNLHFAHFSFPYFALHII